MSSLNVAVDVLAHDGLLAFPTETVWGLAAVATSEVALEALRHWKGRDAEQPVAILLDSPERLSDLDCEAGSVAGRLIDAFWPGPLTLVLPTFGAGGLARGVARADGAVGFRCSPHPRAAELSAAAFARGLGPLTATSLNRHGQPPAGSVEEAHEIVSLRGEQDSTLPRVAILDPAGTDAFGERPSTVVDLAAPTPRVRRWGAIDADEIEPLLGGVASRQ